MCNDGMFQCAFDLVFGVGLAVICLIVVAAVFGIEFASKHEGEKHD